MTEEERDFQAMGHETRWPRRYPLVFWFLLIVLIVPSVIMLALFVGIGPN
jgi:hypothetical protein